MRRRDGSAPFIHSLFTSTYNSGSPWEDKLTGHGLWKHMRDVKKHPGYICSLHPPGNTMTVWIKWQFWDTFTLFTLRASKPDSHSFIYKGAAPSVWFQRLHLLRPFLCLVLSPAVRMDTGLCISRYPLLVLLSAVCALSGIRSPVALAGRSCADTRQVYAEKGYGTSSAPMTQISGKTLHQASSGSNHESSSLNLICTLQHLSPLF